jgi:hypothetical protein
MARNQMSTTTTRTETRRLDFTPAVVLRFHQLGTRPPAKPLLLSRWEPGQVVGKELATGDKLMSRVIIDRHPNGCPHAVAGWDEPLNSYFFQVFDDQEELIYDVGANRPNELMSIPSLRLKAGEYERFLTQRVTTKLKWMRALRDQTTEADLSAPQTAA